MTKGTITIKRKNGIYDQLWYVNSSVYLAALGKEIFNNLKTVYDVEQAVVIFNKSGCYSKLETDFILGEVDPIDPILAQFNDYSYALDEETRKWGFYRYKENKLHNYRRANY